MTAVRQRRLRRLFSGRMSAVALLLAGLLPANAADLRVELFEVGIARSCFPNVNVNDALAAYRVLLANIGRRHGFEVKPEVTIYDDTLQFAAAIKRGTMYFAVMDTWQYLDMGPLKEIRPIFVPAFDGQVGRRYLVLVRRGSGLRTVADLLGRSVIRLETLNNGICRGWLETLLPEDPSRPTSDFFELVESATKPTAAVLPVFFGRKDACVVDERTFELMKELNPQVGSVLEAIATSDVFVDTVTCLGEQNWVSPEAREDAMRTVSDLAAEPAGRQVLTLFRISGQISFRDEQLDTVRALRRLHASRRIVSAAGGDRP